jgi:hypothetical protein
VGRDALIAREFFPRVGKAGFASEAETGWAIRPTLRFQLARND